MRIYALFVNDKLWKSFIHRESIDVYIEKYLDKDIEGLEIKVFEEVKE